MIAQSAAYVYGMAVLPKWEAEIPIARERDGLTQYLPVRALCLVLGIDSKDQLDVLRSDSRYADALREIPIKTQAGWRMAVWLRKQQCALWLAGIDPARCKLAAQGPLADFQQALMEEADRLLWSLAPRVPVADRSRTDYQQQERIKMVCQDCGAPHTIVVENGAVLVLRDREGSGEE